MKITSVEENTDGGASVVIEDMSAEETAALIEAGFIHLLEKFLDEEKARKAVPAILRGDRK